MVVAARRSPSRSPAYRAWARASNAGNVRAICSATAKKVRRRAFAGNVGVAAVRGVVGAGAAGTVGGSGGNSGGLFERVHLTSEVLGERCSQK